MPFGNYEKTTYMQLSNLDKYKSLYIIKRRWYPGGRIVATTHLRGKQFECNFNFLITYITYKEKRGSQTLEYKRPEYRVSRIIH